MAKYRLTSPDGGTFEITAPDDATPEQVISYAQSQWKPKDEPKKAPERSFGENIALGTRNAIEGLVNTAGILTDPAASAINMVAGTNIRPYRETVPELLTQAGFPKPESEQERMVARVSRETVGLLPTMGYGALTQGAKGTAGVVSRALAEKPGVQIAGAAGSALAGQTAQEAGASPSGEFLAALGGSVAGTGLAEGAKAVGRGISAALQPLTQSGRERIVADTLLRASGDPDNLATRVEAGMLDTERRLPGSPVTTAQAARDPGLMVLESGLRSDAQRVGGQGGMSGAVSFRDVEAQRNAARQGFMQGLADDLTPEMRGETVRGGIKESLGQAKQAVGRAYQDAEKAGAAIPADDLKQAAGEAAAKFYGPGSGGAPAPFKAVLEEIGQAKGPQNFEWYQNVRSRLGEIAGMASRSGENRLAAAAGAVRQSLDDLSGNVAGDAAALRREMGRTFGRDESGASAVGNILKTDQYGAPMVPAQNVAAQALANPQAVRQTLKAAGPKSAEVKAALRGQFVENMMTATKTTGGMVDAAGNVSDALSPANFKRFFDKNAAVAKELFDEPGQFTNLQRLANDFSETQLSTLTAKARGSDTVQNLSVGNLIARASNGLIEPNSPLAQTVVGLGPIMKVIYSAPEAAMREMLVDAARNPKVARMLLEKAGPQSVRRASEYLNSTMADRIMRAAESSAYRIQQQAQISQQNGGMYGGQ